MIIPKQLQNEEFRFCLLNKWCKWKEIKNNYYEEIEKINLSKYIKLKNSGRWKELGKAPFEKDWVSKNNYKYNDKKLLDNININKNYGVVVGYGNLRVLDIDDINIVEKLDKKINTFTVKTGSGGRHYYFISDYDNNHILNNNAGELRCKNYQVVGPNSKHPSGNIYEVINDSEIKKITVKEIKNVLKLFDVEKKDNEEEQIILNNKEFISKYILPTLSPKIVNLITLKHNIDSLNSLNIPSRSERDQKVITHLIIKGWGRYIKSVFMLYPVGDKYKEQGDKYLFHSIKTARKYSGVENDNFLMLEREINNAGVLLKLKLDFYLKKILNIKDWVQQRSLISLIAFKTKIGKSIILRRLRELELDNNFENAASILDLINKEEENIKYWMYPIIPKNYTILLGGKPGSFKSFFVLLLSLHLKTKKKFLDKYDVIDTPSILIYDLENSKRTFISRIKYVLDKNDIDYLKTGFHLKNNFNISNIKSELKEAMNYDVIILDSYVRFLKDSENKSEIVNEFYHNFIKPLKDENKTIIIIHHLKKREVENINLDDLLELFRGSGDITAQIDLVYSLFTTQPKLLNEKTLNFKVGLYVAKNRDGLPVENITFEVLKNDDKQKTYIKLLHNQPLALKKSDMIKQLILKILNENKEMSRKAIITKVKQEIDTSEVYVLKMLSLLKNIGFITQIRHGYYMLNEDEERESIIK